jgi:hypothetical protein
MKNLENWLHKKKLNFLDLLKNWLLIFQIYSIIDVFE